MVPGSPQAHTESLLNECKMHSWIRKDGLARLLPEENSHLSCQRNPHVRSHPQPVQGPRLPLAHAWACLLLAPELPWLRRCLLLLVCIRQTQEVPREAWPHPHNPRAGFLSLSTGCFPSREDHPPVPLTWRGDEKVGRKRALGPRAVLTFALIHCITCFYATLYGIYATGFWAPWTTSLFESRRMRGAGGPLVKVVAFGEHWLICTC